MIMLNMMLIVTNRFEYNDEEKTVWWNVDDNAKQKIYTVEMGQQFEEDPADISHLYKRRYLKIQNNNFFFLSSHDKSLMNGETAF